MNLTTRNRGNTVFRSKLIRESKNSTANGQFSRVWPVEPLKAKNVPYRTDFGLAEGEQ